MMACVRLWVFGFVWVFLSPAVRADSGPVLSVAGFSEAAPGSHLPDGWEPLTFKKIPRHTDYDLVEEDGRVVVRARSSAGASGLVRRLRIDLEEYPVIQWRWKVMNILKTSDVRARSGDDYPARLYITFEYQPDKVDFLKKAKYKAGRLLFGDIPIAAINYIWESREPEGTVVDNAYTGFAKMIVVESGDRRLGQWVEEERNVYKDYRRAFGGEPPPVNGVAIMTDTDDTGEAATAYYGDIVFKKGAD